MQKNSFVRSTLPYVLVGTFLFNSCGCNKNSKNEEEIVIPKLPSYDAKAYVFNGEIINGRYLQFVRDVDNSYDKSTVSRGIHVIDNKLQEFVGSKKLIGKLILGKDTNKLIIREPEKGIERTFYDYRGAGENNDRGDLLADTVVIDREPTECNRQYQREFALALIDIYIQKQKIKAERKTNLIKDVSNTIKKININKKDSRSKEGNKSGFWKKIRSIK